MPSTSKVLDDRSPSTGRVIVAGPVLNEKAVHAEAFSGALIAAVVDEASGIHDRGCADAPQALSTLETRIDEVAGVARWVER